MDVSIDHSVPNTMVSEMEQHCDGMQQAWRASVREFEELKGSGAMLGASSETCQLVVQRTNEHVEQLVRKDRQWFEDVTAAHADDLRTEEESAGMFTGLGNQ